MKIGENIKRIRKEKKMTQRELGEKLGGISQQQIGQWENGDKNPKIETIQKIAQALGVESSELDERIYSFHEHTIGENIIHLRQNRKMTITDLAILTNIPESLLVQYETGKSQPCLDDIYKLADTLQINSYDLDPRLSKMLTYFELYTQWDSAATAFSSSPDTYSLKQAEYYYKQYLKISDDFSEEELERIFNDKFAKLQSLFSKLNESGKDKAIEYLETLTFNPKYIINDSD